METERRRRARRHRGDPAADPVRLRFRRLHRHRDQRGRLRHQPAGVCRRAVGRHARVFPGRRGRGRQSGHAAQPHVCRRARRGRDRPDTGV